MKIFISQNFSIIKSYKEKINYLSCEWSNFFAKKRPDIKLIPIPNDPKVVENYFNFFNPDGLVLSNGNDIEEYSDRDKTEFKLVNKFLEKKKPIFGICRGLQFLNYFFNSHIPKELNEKIKKNHVNKIHQLKICDKKFDFFNRKTINVNSFHNKGVLNENVAKNFKVFALSEDGVVEGIYDSKKKIYGIQWHIERKSPDQSYNLKLLNEIFKKKTNS
tara:strand:- start:39655 stop:40305 length:651 start_codon:yes stop_codon:yes gene_type:complete